MLRLIFVLPLLIFLAPVLLLGGAALLAFKGSPGDCGNGRTLQVDPALAQSYEQRWIAFNAQLTAGRPATLSVTDSEATSRAREFLATTGAPVKDVRLCFVPGGGDINGKVTTPLGPEVAVRVKGKVDLSGRHPKTTVDSIQVGALPSFVARPFRGLVTRIIDDQTSQIELDHRLTVQVDDGQVLITGQP